MSINRSVAHGALAIILLLAVAAQAALPAGFMPAPAGSGPGARENGLVRLVICTAMGPETILLKRADTPLVALPGAQASHDAGARDHDGLGKSGPGKEGQGDHGGSVGHGCPYGAFVTQHPPLPLAYVLPLLFSLPSLFFPQPADRTPARLTQSYFPQGPPAPTHA